MFNLVHLFIQITLTILLVDNVTSGMDKLEQSILEIEAKEAAATAALMKEQEESSETADLVSSPTSEVQV